MKLYDKRDDFNFLSVNIPYICSDIPAAPAYRVYIFHLIRYSITCGSYYDFREREILLTRKYWTKLKLSCRKFYRRRHDLVDRLYLCHNDQWYVPSVVITIRSYRHSWLITRFVKQVTRRVPLVDQELLTLPEHMSSPPVFSGVRVIQSLVFFVVFCRSIVCPFSLDHCIVCPFSLGHCIVCPFSLDHCIVCPISLDHCIVCPSSIYDFWLPLWYLPTFLICIIRRDTKYFENILDIYV